LRKLYDGLSAGPLLIFDKSGSVLVISAFNNFMAASYEHDTVNSTVSWGIMGKVNSIPKGFQYSTIMYYSDNGINKVIYNLFCEIIKRVKCPVFMNSLATWDKLDQCKIRQSGTE